MIPTPSESDSLGVLSLAGTGIETFPLFRFLHEHGRTLTLFHYTDRAGFESLMARGADLLPSLGATAASATRSSGAVPGHPLPPEAVRCRPKLTDDIGGIILLILKVPGEDMLDLSSGSFGPGWYLTDLPPTTRTDALLDCLWGGDSRRSTWTEFWISLRISEFKVRSPSMLQPHLWFLPIADKIRVSSEGNLFTQNLSSVVLEGAGSRRDTRSGAVSVRRVVWRSRELIPPHQFMIDGWSTLTADKQERLLRYFGVRPRRPSRLTDDSPEAHAVNELHRLYGDRELDLALERAEEFTARFPSVADLWSNRGAILAALGRRREAVDSYYRALELNPDYRQARINLAASLIRLGEMGPAVVCINELLQNDPDDADAWYNRSTALVELRSWDAALRSCDRFLTLAPGHPRAHNAKVRRRYCQTRTPFDRLDHALERLKRLWRGW